MRRIPCLLSALLVLRMPGTRGLPLVPVRPMLPIQCPLPVLVPLRELDSLAKVELRQVRNRPPERLSFPPSRL